MSDIQHTTGVFQKFQAKVGFHLGRLSHNLEKDSIVEFDGTTMKLDGVSHSYPELRAAIRSEWMTLVGSNVGEYLAKSANVKVRSAKAGGPPASTEVQRDETFVAPARKLQATTTDGVRMDAKQFDRTVVRDTEGDGRTVGSAIRRPAANVGGRVDASSEGETVARVNSNVNTAFTLDGSTTMRVREDGSIQGSEGIRGAKPQVRRMAAAVEAREAQVVGGIKTSPAKRKAVVENSNSVSQEISKIERQRSVLAPKGKAGVSAVSGDTVEEILPALEPSGQAALVAEQKRQARLAAVAKSEAATGTVTQPAKDPEVKAPVKAAAKVVKAAAKAAPAPKSVEDYVVNGDDLEIAPGVRWNKKLHWKIRVKNALQYKDNPDVLAAILAYEVPSVVKLINESLPS